jgi:hypothetical protein
MRAVLVWWAVLLTSCTFDGGGVALGDGGTADAAIPDAEPDAGCTGLELDFRIDNVPVCLPAPGGVVQAPQNAVTLIDTSTGTILFGDAPATDVVSVFVTQPDGVTAAMVIVADDVRVRSGATVRIVGIRPLIVVATGEITIAGVIDASGTLEVAGPGADLGCVGSFGSPGVTVDVTNELAGGTGGGGAGGALFVQTPSLTVNGGKLTSNGGGGGQGRRATDPGQPGGDGRLDSATAAAGGNGGGGGGRGGDGAVGTNDGGDGQEGSGAEEVTAGGGGGGGGTGRIHLHTRSAPQIGGGAVISPQATRDEDL